MADYDKQKLTELISGLRYTSNRTSMMAQNLKNLVARGASVEQVTPMVLRLLSQVTRDALRSGGNRSDLREVHQIRRELTASLHLDNYKGCC